MNESEAAAKDACARCARDLSAEKPVPLPDGRIYCAACCERMATDAFEMETGTPFVPWIEKHPELVMRHLPGEMHIRRMGFVIPLVCAVCGLLLIGIGVWKAATAGDAAAGAEAALRETLEAAARRKGWAFAGVGAGTIALFGWLSWRQGKAFWRARDFTLRLKDGVFTLSYGTHRETFTAADVKQACIVRPGTVGASEGALGLADGRMLTLDTCLSDLHALGVVMDLRFREDFPPSQEDLARERRNKLRKIRGLS
ncbi:MAG: hypothetical protein KIS92_15560 [Planctomycetota bacterium]|nr:hypothetical protein [Planctomycetota bacterium]